MKLLNIFMQYMPAVQELLDFLAFSFHERPNCETHCLLKLCQSHTRWHLSRKEKNFISHIYQSSSSYKLPALLCIEHVCETRETRNPRTLLAGAIGHIKKTSRQTLHFKIYQLPCDVAWSCIEPMSIWRKYAFQWQKELSFEWFRRLSQKHKTNFSFS